jgi:DNA-binding transcriptional ArsR family regulator
VLEPDDLDNALRALAHVDRRRIVGLLMNSRLPSGEVAARLQLPASTCSEQLRVLRAAGLVQLEAHGNWRFYRTNTDRLHDVVRQLGELSTKEKGTHDGTADRPLRHHRP